MLPAEQIALFQTKCTPSGQTSMLGPTAPLSLQTVVPVQAPTPLQTSQAIVASASDSQFTPPCTQYPVAPVGHPESPQSKQLLSMAHMELQPS